MSAKSRVYTQHRIHGLQYSNPPPPMVFSVPKINTNVRGVEEEKEEKEKEKDKKSV